MADDSPQHDPLFDPDRDVVTPATALAGLAHPLRLRLLGMLRAYGPSTATRLAARCGESSGLTSYHLRQLASAGFIVDADEEGGGRERWWKAARRSTYTLAPPPGDEAAAAVSEDYLQAVLATYADNARRWLSTAHAWPQEWQDVSELSDVPLRLTAPDVVRLRSDIAAVLATYRRSEPTDRPGVDGVPAGSVIVSAQYQIFPRADQDPPTADLSDGGAA